MIRNLAGNWDAGFVLDKHTVSSRPIGQNEWGHTVWDTQRTPTGEALYQLKYKHDFSQIPFLAGEVRTKLGLAFPNVHLIVPMPASTWRPQQPVHAIAAKLGEMMGVPSFNNVLLKHPGGPKLKDLKTREEKVEALQGRLFLNDAITGIGPYNVLLLDDLYESGASAEAACATLRQYPKIGRIYFAALTWRRPK
jgi:predicted amidophosphoribosyltransferase